MLTRRPYVTTIHFNGIKSKYAMNFHTDACKTLYAVNENKANRFSYTNNFLQFSVIFYFVFRLVQLI